MKYTWILILFSIVISSCTPQLKDQKDDQYEEKVTQVIMDKARSVVWALNESNADTLLRDFWRSDSAKFILNGRVVNGYEEIAGRLQGAMDFRKEFELTVSEEEVMVLSPESAIHVAQFRQVTTTHQDSVRIDNGTWTALYRKIGNDWKVVMVHESYFPVEQRAE